MSALNISQNLKIKQTLSQKMIQSVGLLQMSFADEFPGAV